jgi:hypothetical protein
MRCSCCGQERDEAVLTALHCDDSVQLCRDCIGWLRQRAGVVDVTPILPVADMDAAVQFCEAAGFEVRRYDDGYAFAQLDGQSVFDLDLVAEMDPASNHAGCYLITPDADAWHVRLVVAQLPVSGIEDQPWGMREFTLTGPSGCSIRIGRSIPE